MAEKCSKCSCEHVYDDHTYASSAEVVYESGGFHALGNYDGDYNSYIDTGGDDYTCGCKYFDTNAENYNIEAAECEGAKGAIGSVGAYEEVYSAWEAPSLFKSGTASTADVDGDYAIEDIVIVSQDDWEFMEEWGFDVEIVDDTTFDDLATGAVGIWFEHIQDEGGEYFDKIYHATFEHDEPTISDGEWTSTTDFAISAALDSDEESALEASYGPTADDLETALKSVAVTIGEIVALSTADAAHTFKKIRSAEFDENTFDVFEKEETQTVVVSTTYSSTVTYQ